MQHHMDDKSRSFPPSPYHLFLFLHFYPHPPLTRGHLFPLGEKNQFDAIRDAQDPGRTSSAFCRERPRKGSRESGRNSCCTFLSTQEDARKERGENDENSRDEPGTALSVTLPDPAPCSETSETECRVPWHVILRWFFTRQVTSIVASKDLH